MKIKELRELTSDELLKKHQGFKKEIFDLNYQRKIGQVEKPSRFGLLRRDIARILTILKERELNNERNAKKN